jgi:hypothetical protein
MPAALSTGRLQLMTAAAGVLNVSRKDGFQRP